MSLHERLADDLVAMPNSLKVSLKAWSSSRLRQGASGAWISLKFIKNSTPTVRHRISSLKSGHSGNEKVGNFFQSSGTFFHFLTSGNDFPRTFFYFLRPRFHLLRTFFHFPTSGNRFPGTFFHFPTSGNHFPRTFFHFLTSGRHLLRTFFHFFPSRNQFPSCEIRLDPQTSLKIVRTSDQC